MKVIVSIVLIICSLTVISQTPGYMGKRFVAGYGLYASPGYIGSNGITPVNTLHEVFLEFAAKKRFSVGFSARFYNATSNNTRSVKIFSINNSISLIDQVPSGVTNIKGRNYMVYVKFFNNKFLAPWGRYFTLGASFNTFTSSYDPDQMNVTAYSTSNYTNNYILYSDFGPVKQTHVKFDVMMGWGRSRIIANRLVIDYGFNINVWALTATLFDIPTKEQDVIFDHQPILNTSYVGTTSATRVRSVNRFNVFCKIGILLF